MLNTLARIPGQPVAGRHHRRMLHRGGQGFIDQHGHHLCAATGQRHRHGQNAFGVFAHIGGPQAFDAIEGLFQRRIKRIHLCQHLLRAYQLQARVVAQIMQSACERGAPYAGNARTQPCNVVDATGTQGPVHRHMAHTTRLPVRCSHRRKCKRG